MHIRVFICASGDRLKEIRASDLAEILADGRVEDVGEEISFAASFVNRQADLRSRLLSFIENRSAPSIVVSDWLTRTVAGKHEPSDFANELEEMTRTRDACSGLIALVHGNPGRVDKIDSLVAVDPLRADVLRAKVLAVANRLWLKEPPPRDIAPRDAATISVRSVDRIEEFRACLALRKTVYQRLGYLEDGLLDVDIELDGYDVHACHFAAVDSADGNRVVGTMRLIVPGLDRNLPSVRRLASQRDYKGFCHQLADAVESRILRRKLDGAHPSALPIFDPFNYFEQQGNEEQIVPRVCCEMSRLVVAPRWRGAGISRKLIETAIAVARGLGRQYLLLGCASYHRRMYENYGFEVFKSPNGRPTYARAQSLDQTEVAMRCNLSPAPQAEESADRSAATGRYRLRVSEGPQSGWSLFFQSRRFSSSDLEGLLRKPLPFDPLSRAANPQSHAMTARGAASLASRLLASISVGRGDQMLAYLGPFLAEHAPLTVSAEDPHGVEWLRIDAAGVKQGSIETLTDTWKRRQERHHG